MSKDKDTLLKYISADVLPEILRREQGNGLYLDKEIGEMVSYAEMKARGWLETAPVEVKRDLPL